ncbi:MAG: folA [Rhizobacter sp.]|nr:folA [Rhizobacter sp.]
MKLALIAAVARDGAIGRDNDLLFKLREDMQHFKRTTLGCPVVMGRKTWDSIGRPLPGRRNIVVTRKADWAAEGCERAGSLDEALALVADAERVFVIGGAQLYAAALPLADELVLTEIDAEVEGADTFFPAWERAAFVEASRESHVNADGLTYHFVTRQRR